MNLGEILTIVLGIDLTRLTVGLETAKRQVKNFSEKTEAASYGFKIESAFNMQAGGLKNIDTALDKVKGKMGEVLSISNQMSLTAMRTILAGGAAVMVAMFPTKEAAQFEKQMSMVRGITQATTEQMKALESAAMKMAQTTVYTATQAAEAMSVLAKAGFSVNEIITIMPSVMYLAAAGEMSIAEAADIASNALHGFNKSAEDFAHIADVIAYSAALSNINVKDMGQSLNYVAPAAAAAKMSIDDTAAALAVLGNAGIKGSMGGTTLRQVLLRLTDESQTFVEKLDQLGVRALDLTGQMRPFVEIMEELSKANLTVTQAGGIFTARSATGAIAMARGVEDLKRFSIENKNAAGEAKRLADVVLNNLVGSFEHLKASISSISIILASSLLAPLKLAVDGISLLLNVFGTVADYVFPVKWLASAVIILTGAVGGLLLVMGGAGILVSGFMRSVAFLADATGYLSGATLKSMGTMTGLSLSLSPVGAAISTLLGKMKLLTASFLLNPILWTAVTVAIGVVVYAIYRWITANDKALDSAKKAAEAATISRKEFENYAKTLSETAVGTGEHDRVITELIQKYPDLAGVIRLTNQSLEDQLAILNNFKLDLFKRELEKSFELAGKLTDKLEQLENQKAAMEGMELVPDVQMMQLTGEAYDPGWKVNAVNMQRVVFDKLRAEQAIFRLQWDKWLSSINWERIGKPPLDLIRSTRAEFEEVFKSEDESVRRIRDGLLAQNTTLEKQLSIREKITKAIREQLELDDSKKVAPLELTQFRDFREAQRTMEGIIIKFNQDLGETIFNNAIDPDTGKKVQDVLTSVDKEKGIGLFASMETAAARFGPRVTQIMAKDLRDLIEEFKGFKSASDSTIREFILRAQTLASKWNDIIKDMKPLTIGLTQLGGANWNEISTRLGVNFAEMSSLKDLINEKAKGGILTQALSMGVLMSGPQGAMRIPVTETEKALKESTDKILSGLTAVTNCGDTVAAAINTIATGPKLPRGGLTPENIVRMASAYGSQLYSSEQTPFTADFMRKNFGVGTAMVTAQQGTHAQMVAPSPTTGELGILSYKQGSPYWETFEQAAAIMKSGYTATNIIGGATGVLTKLEDSINKYKGEVDQVKKGLAAFRGETIPVSVPFDQLKISEETNQWIDNVLTNMEKASKDKGFNLYDELKAKREQDRARNTVEVVKNLLETGKKPTPISLVEERKGKIAEYAAMEAEQQAKIRKLTESGAQDALSPSKIKEATDQLQTMREQNAAKLADFDKQASAKMANLTEQNVRLRLMAAENELAAAENVFKIHQSDAAAMRATRAAQVEMGTMTGGEAATQAREEENRLYEEQLVLLESKRVLVEFTAEQEAKAIAAKAGSQTQEETAKQYRELALKTEKELKDILTQKAEATNKNVEAMQKLVEEAAKARKELVGIGIDQITKFAWGPIQERAAALLKNAKEYSDLSTRISAIPVPTKTGPGGLIKGVDADPNLMKTVDELAKAATALNSPWAKTLGEITTEFINGVTPERFAELKEQLQIEIIPQIKAEGEFQIRYKDTIDAGATAIKDGISSMIDAMMDGGADLKKAASTMFKNLFNASIKEGLDTLQQALINGFKSLFGEVGGAVGSAIMGVIGIIGMMLTKDTGGSFTSAGVETGVTSHEAVRGIVAGDTSLPIAQINVGLQDALVTTNGILMQIEQNTRTSGGGIGVTVNAEGLQQRVKDAIQQVMDEYFRDVYMQGSRA